MLGGCASGRNNAHGENSGLTMKDAATIQNELNTAGWQVQSTSAASFHMFEDLNPTSLTLAEDTEDQVLVIASFENADQAAEGYEATVPTSGDGVETTNENGVVQAWIPLPDGSGYWLFRQIDEWVIGGWTNDANGESAMINLFDSFTLEGAAADQQNAPDVPAGA